MPPNMSLKGSFLDRSEEIVANGFDGGLELLTQKISEGLRKPDIWKKPRRAEDARQCEEVKRAEGPLLS